MSGNNRDHYKVARRGRIVEKYRPPTIAERTVLFNYLKRASSLSAWERIFERYSDVVKRLEAIYFDASNQRKALGLPYLLERDLDDFRDCHLAFKKGIERLRAGDRRCFRWSQMPGHFSEGLRMLDSVKSSINRVYQGETPPRMVESPRWPELASSFRACFGALDFCEIILEPRWTDLPAPLEGPETDYREGMGDNEEFLSQFLHSLPEAPRLKPEETVFVIQTGERTPISGIWEPCIAPKPRSGFLDFFRRQQCAISDLIVNPEGCMNYLHQGGDAPTIAFPGDTARREGKPISWYLLWEDQRYGSNGIPEEEQSYVYPPVDPRVFPDLSE